ncbi:MAG: alpha-amylase family glycosyl hydrolase [Elusimicrobiales bacterium]
MMRANPHLLEINTRLFIDEMRRKYNQPDMTLSMIPDEEWLKIKHLGFDIVWLMGVWESSPVSEKISQDEEFLRDFVRVHELDVSVIGSSVYSIKRYRLDPSFGFEWEIKSLKDKLNSFGILLFLDFVSNHMAIDADFSDDCIDCFVLGTEKDYNSNPDLFCQKIVNGRIYYIAHGRDPNFPCWKDTIQLNYFNPKTRQKMLEELLKISEMCDGVRCDMVMLSLNDVHESIWGWLNYRNGYKKPDKEFWEEAISKVKEINPLFTFLAEVYWGLEWRMQQLGFDYTYDKVFYDRLRNMTAQDVIGHLRAEKLYQKRSVRFIDNHDEEPSIVCFNNKRKALCSGVMVSTVRGMRFYNDMQIKGVNIKIPVQIKSMDVERYRDIEVEKFYEKLLRIVDHPAFHGGEWELCEVLPLNNEDSSFKNIIAYKWMQMRTVKIVVINYSSVFSSGRVMVSFRLKNGMVTLYEEFSERFFSYSHQDVSKGIVLKDIQPFGFFIFDYEF